MKSLLQKCREIDKMSTSRAIVKALIMAYEEIRELSSAEHHPHHAVDPNSGQFHALKELAKRFANSFGTDNLRNREVYALMHTYVLIDRLID